MDCCGVCSGYNTRMGRNVLKYSAGALGLVAVAIGFLFLVEYLRYRTSSEYRVEQGLKELERRYAEDTYGGTTPEETLQLFIDALKKGDTDLASKFFVLEDQEERLVYLREVKAGGNLNIVIEELSFPYTKRVFGANDDSHYILDIYNPKDDTHIQFDVAKDPKGVWKIVDL